MVRYHRVKMLVENDVHAGDFHRRIMAFENMVDALGRAVEPAIDMSLETRFEKSMRMQFVKLVDVFSIADDVVVGVFAGRGIEIAHHQVTADAEIFSGVYQSFQIPIFLEKAMMRPA